MLLPAAANSEPYTDSPCDLLRLHGLLLYFGSVTVSVPSVSVLSRGKRVILLTGALKCFFTIRIQVRNKFMVKWIYSKEQHK